MTSDSFFELQAENSECSESRQDGSESRQDFRLLADNRNSTRVSLPRSRIASEQFRGESAGGSYGDTIEEIDWSLGQILDALKQAGIDDDTRVIFTSDNGPWIESHLANSDGSDPYYGSAGPLRGYKMTTWEGGLRVPCIVRWPGRVPAGVVSQSMLCSMDLLPTFAHLAGASLPDDRKLDGQNIWPALSRTGEAQDHQRTFYYYCYNHLQAVRQGRWKLVLPRRAKPPWCSWSARMVDAVPEMGVRNPTTF